MMSGWPLAAVIAAFLAAAAGITVFGVWMTRVAAVLAVRTGLGEAVMGAFFIGACTSLAEVVTSTAAAWQGYPDLAVSNAVGSIAGQSAFLAVADMTYRRANLEHAAASAENLMLAGLLMLLLAVVALGIAAPRFGLGGVHVTTPCLLVVYLYGLKLVSGARDLPMWRPRHTRETRTADAGEDNGEGPALRALWLRFAAAAVVVAGAGWLLAETAFQIAERTVLSETVVGGVLTGLAGSVPELVTALTAVRLGKLTLAMGDILGGNAFDTVIVGMADIAHGQGSIYLAVDSAQLYLVALSMMLTAVVLLGMLKRERHGIANIGTESFAVLVIYLGGMAGLVALG